MLLLDIDPADQVVLGGLSVSRVDRSLGMDLMWRTLEWTSICSSPAIEK